MRVSEPIEQDTSSQADSQSDQEDVASEEDSFDREDEADSDSSDSEVSVEDLKRVTHCCYRCWSTHMYRRPRCRALKYRLSSFCNRDRKEA